MAEIKKISTELQLLDKFLDTSGDAGTSGQVLTSTGTGINWVSGGSLPGGPYVTIGTTQTITGAKTFSTTANFYGNGAAAIKFGNTSALVTLSYSGTTGIIRSESGSALQFHTNGVNTALTIAYFTKNVGMSGSTTSPIDELHVEGVIQSKKQLLPSTSGTAGWYKIGTMSGFVQGGATAVLEIAGHSGYNALNNQDYLIKLFIKTSNASSVGPDGQKFNSWYERTGGNNSTIEFKWNNSATNDYDLYMFIPTHSLRSWYSIKKGTGTWDHVGTSASDPGANSSTVLKATGLFNILDANVGIRTANATDTLTVNGNLSIFGNKIYNGSASNSAGVSFPNSTTRIDGYSGITFHSSTTTVGSQSERMRITNAGNVGIGTTTVQNKLVVRGSGSAFNSTMQNSTASIISKELTDNAYHSILQLVAVRQSLTTGKDSQGYLGFSTIDDSNNQGQLDAGRIAIVNETGSSRNSATALTFWTNPGGTQTTAAVEKMRISSAGAIKFNAYDSTNNTGTPTYILGTDASGNVVKVLGGDIPGGGGTVTGTGTTNRLTKFTDGANGVIGNSGIQDASTL